MSWAGYDHDLNGIIHNQFLQWSDIDVAIVPATGTNGAVTGVPSSIKDLSDVDDAMVPNDGDSLVWDSASSMWTSQAVTGGGAYSEVIGNGSDTVFTITHNLNSLAVVVATWEFDTGTVWDEIEVAVETVDANSIKLTFASAPATNDVRVVVLADGSSAATPVDIPWNVDPVGGEGDARTWPFANRAIYTRITANKATISKIAFYVVTSSGNISVATLDNSGTGTSAAPSTRRQTSGATACPAAGRAEVALGASDAVEPGDWFGMSCDNTTASFRQMVPIKELTDGLAALQNAAHPVPASPSASAQSALVPLLQGII